VNWLNYHHLFYFWTVVRTGGVKAAGKQLRLAAPTVSAQIRDLERSLAVTLLERRGRNLVPTDTGRMVFRYADEIFSLGREMVDAVREGHSGPHPVRIVIGIADVLPKLIAHWLIEPALKLSPPVRIVCREDNPEHLLAALALHELDVVLADAPIGPNIKVHAYNHLLGECGISFVGTAELVASRRGRFPRSLDGAPMLLPTDNTALRRSLDQWFSEHQIRPAIVGEFEDYALLRVFGETGAGFFPAPSVLDAQLTRQYGLKQLGRTREVRGRYYAISAEKNLRHPAVVAICETARRKLFGSIRRRK
jgi:LysR family transcriptional regulator, transcriptional activator of nhaA